MFKGKLRKKGKFKQYTFYLVKCVITVSIKSIPYLKYLSFIDFFE